jgi:hypothetical protein
VTRTSRIDRLAGLPGYYRSIFSTECGGPRRQKAPASRGLNIRAGEQLTATSRDTGRWNVMMVWRDANELYLYGTALIASKDPKGWVERIDPVTLEPHKRVEIETGGHIWCGAIAVHANGDLYAANGRYLTRLHPSLEIVAECRLPADAPYNGLLFLHDGRIATKDMSLGGRRSHMLIIDPETLAIQHDVELPEASMGRIASDWTGEADDIYVPGEEHLYRVVVNKQSAFVDESWMPQYRTRGDGSGLAWDSCITGDSVWLQTNGDIPGVHGILDASPAGSVEIDPAPGQWFREPLRLWRFSLADGASTEAFMPDERPGGWCIAPPVFVPEHGIAVGFDSGNGMMAAWRGEGGAFRPIWRRPVRNFWQPLVYPDTAELLVDDVREGSDDVVILDLLTGEEKARGVTGSSQPNGMFPCPGQERDFYYVSNPVIARVQVVAP